MKFGVMIILALKNLKRNRKRTFLTMLGIIIGIAAVITIVALGQGQKQEMIESFTGEEKESVELMVSYTGNDPNNPMSSRSAFNNNDKKIVEKIDGVESVELMSESDGFSKNVSAKVKDKTIQSQLEGVKEEQLQPEYADNVVGRNINKQDIEKQRRVAVVYEGILGTDLKDKDLEEYIGRVLTIDGINLEIVGIKKIPDEAEISFSMTGYGIQAAQSTINQYYNSGSSYVGMNISLTKDASVEEITTDVQDTLNDKGSKSDSGEYYIFDMQSMLKMMGSVLDMLTLFIAAVGGISLFIAGIGVMNMVYTSVSERTIEIGIKRAIGARRRDIRLEFLIEGVTIAVCGGIIGLIVGVLSAQLLGLALGSKVVTDLFTAGIAIGISALIGILSSILPANKAATANTVDILR